MLDASYIIECEQRARRFSGAFTGTSGTLAADVLRLLDERRELMGALEASGTAAATDKPDAVAGVRVIGLAGHIGSGKSAVAEMIPDACHLQWADPLYRGLAAMLDVPEEALRNRTAKDGFIDVHGLRVVPRDMARTLGTEWGRDSVDPDIWVKLTMQRVQRIHTLTGRVVFAICGTRFPNEVAAIHDHGGEVWWVDRPGLEQGQHKSDRSLTREECDRVIVNSGTMDTLRRTVERAWRDFVAAT
jgi:hypothetical protein